jgi:endonuclease/exonuclease/phosphatase family metal-dependent hydrolase
MRFSVMSYNIYRGFHDNHHQLNNNRLEAAQRIVSNYQPDILCLNEALYCFENQFTQKMDYAKQFKYKYSFAAEYKSFKGLEGIGANCLLSKYPLIAKRVPLGIKSAIRSEISIDDKILNLDLVHLSFSLTPTTNLKHIRKLLNSINEPYILAGDFNAISPKDQYNKKELVQEYYHFSANPDKDVEILTKCQLITKVLSFGLEDSCIGFETTAPTSIKGRNVKGSRIDYIFKKELKQIDFITIKNDDANIASDHYPIMGIYEFN